MLETTMLRSPSYTSVNEEAVSLRLISSNGLFMQIVESEQEQKLPPSTEYTSTSVAAEQLSIPKPVYVQKNVRGEDEGIVYNSLVMESGKQYEVIYKGEKWALKKTSTDVEFMKYYPD
jgi:hypothetical protein